MGIREHFDGPFVYAQEEDARVEAVPILGGDEVDVGEFGRWEEDCPGDLGVPNDGVDVEPAFRIDISILADPAVKIDLRSS